MAEGAAPAIEMRGIVKQFGSVRANDGVSISVERGEIHALVGENGAGKSTLMKTLYGLYRPDGGEVFIHGKPARFAGPEDAIASGIGMVHQHFMLVPTLTVAENVVLAREPKTGGGLFFDRDAAEKEVEALSKQYGLALDSRAKIRDLSVGQQQRLEILKILYRGAEILILDEPTAVLTPPEAQTFFGILRALQAQGKTVVLITHKLKEVMAISQSITVMRGGKTIGRVLTRETSEEALAQMMVGRPVLFKVKRDIKSMMEIHGSPAVLTMREAGAMSDRGLTALSNISFEVHAGEIFGIAGVEGNGQTELIELLAGLRPPAFGEILFLNRNIERKGSSAAAMLAQGMAHIPEDRHRRGLVLDYSISDNLILGRHREHIFSNPYGFYNAKVTGFSERLIAAFDIHPSDPALKVRALSGGNQQKVVVARELSCAPRFLLAAQPTRGVDVGAIEFIHKKIIEARDAGAAVLLISAELSEILSLSDRVGVLYRGQLVSVSHIQDVSEEQIGLLMAGGERFGL